MAIVPMKKLRLIGLAEGQTELMEGLQPLGCVELTEPSMVDQDPQWAPLFQGQPVNQGALKAQLSQTKTALDALERYGEVKKGMFDARPVVSGDAFAQGNPLAQTAQETITAQLQTMAQAQAELSRLHTKQSALRPWEALQVPLEYPGTGSVAFAMGVMPSGIVLADVEASLADLPVVMDVVSQDKQQWYVSFVYWRDAQGDLLEALRFAGISFVSFADTVGTARETLKAIEVAIGQCEANKTAAVDAIVAQAPQADVLRQQVDWLESQLDKEGAKAHVRTHQRVMVLEGWVPAEKTDQVEALLQAQGCAWEFSDPVEAEYPDVPVKLKSNWLTKPLNMVTEMYSLPAYQGIDPNPLMAPFFILFYGIMMADMGYGLVMMLMGGYILKKAKPTGTMEHLAGLMCLCGVSTFFVGALTGGFFGDFLTQLALIINPNSTFALPALFTPLEDTLMILIGSMALGLVQIITGMAVSFVYKVKHGDVMGAIWEEVTWWMVFLGGGLAAAKITSIVLYISFAMILVGAGWNQKGFGKITAVFGSLYNHITGYFGDILSYSRLMALMLAGSVIAQVFNTLGAIPGNIIFFLVISFAGNALNFALNLLGCYVHDLRLQCLEYFGKFYQDGGRAFAPLAFKTKYVDIDNK